SQATPVGTRPCCSCVAVALSCQRWPSPSAQSSHTASAHSCRRWVRLPVDSHTRKHAHTHTHVHTQTCTQTCTHAHTHTRTHVHTRTHAHPRTHTLTTKKLKAISATHIPKPR